MNPIRVTIWNEFLDEKTVPLAMECYPDGIHTALASLFEGNPQYEVRTTTLDQPQAGLPDELLDSTDVLLWWGHRAHLQVPEDRIDKVVKRVYEGMGFIALHSGLFSIPMRRMIGPRMQLRFRENGEWEKMWMVDAAHPICRGLPECIEIPQTEMYAEPTGIAMPDSLLYISSFEGGEVFRSCGVYHRGRGRVFYLSCGHEEYPTYYLPEVQQLLRNAVDWVGGRS